MLLLPAASSNMSKLSKILEITQYTRVPWYCCGKTNRPIELPPKSILEDCLTMLRMETTVSEHRRYRVPVTRVNNYSVKIYSAALFIPGNVG